MIRIHVRSVVRLVSGIAIAVAAFGCGRTEAGDRVVVYSSVDRVFAEPVLRRASEVLGIEVVGVYDTEEAKGTGLVARLVAKKDAPDGDLFWSGDPGRAEQVKRAGGTAPFTPAGSESIAPGFRDAEGHWIGFSARWRVLLVNRTLAPDPSDVPTRIEDLALPANASRLALANPVFGTTSYHVAALAEALGEERAMGWLAELKKHGARFAASNGEVKRLVGEGRVAFGLTDSDDAAEALVAGADVRVVLLDQAATKDSATPTATLGTLVLPNTLAQIRGGPNPAGAKRVAEFLLSQETATMLAASCGQTSLVPGLDSPGANVRLKDLVPMPVDPAKCGARLEQLLPRMRTFMGDTSEPAAGR